MFMNISLERMRRWGLMGGMAILDQGVFSGGNFLSNILLARWLYPEDYGAYAIGFAISIFFLQLIMSYILEPMAVLGTSSYGENLKDYLGAQLRLYFVMIVPLSLLFTVVVYFFRQFGGNPLVCNILMAMGLSICFTLLPWMLRRAFYILGRPDISVKGSIIYAVLLITFVNFVKRFDILTGLSAVFTVALSGLIAGFFLAKEVGWNVIAKSVIPLRSVFLENWAFGKWLLASGLLITIGGQAQIFLSGALLGIESAGIVSAMQALSQPMTLSITAISAMVTPNLAADFAKADFVSFKNKAISMTVILTILASIYELLLFLFKTPLESFLFGGKFTANADLIPIWGLTPLIMAMVSGMQYSLLAAKRPYAILIASLLWVPLTLGSGTVLTRYWGLLGVAWSTVFGYLVLGLVLTFLYWYWLRKTFKRVIQI